MGERDSDEGKIFTQLSGSPGLSMSREAESSWNWSPNVAMVSLQDEQVSSKLLVICNFEVVSDSVLLNL
ncbi:unnamed protein product [Prunus armeniaca]